MRGLQWAGGSISSTFKKNCFPLFNLLFSLVVSEHLPNSCFLRRLTRNNLVFVCVRLSRPRPVVPPTPSLEAILAAVGKRFHIAPRRIAAVPLAAPPDAAAIAAAATAGVATTVAAASSSSSSSAAAAEPGAGDTAGDTIEVFGAAEVKGIAGSDGRKCVWLQPLRLLLGP